MVGDFKQAIELGIIDVEISRDGLDNTNTRVDEASIFLATLWQRLDGLQMDILHFMHTKDIPQLGPRILAARERLGSVSAKTLPAIQEATDEATPGMRSLLESLKSRMEAHNTVVEDQLLSFGDIYEGLGTLMQQAREAAEGCTVAVKNGQEIITGHDAIITGLKGYENRM